MSNELIPEAETLTDVPAISDDRLIEIAEKAEKRIEAVRKIKELSLRLTNKHDWTDQNGKPYLQASGAEKIARMFGISWRIEEPKKENFEDGHYMFTYKGTFEAFGVSLEVIGTRNSRDGFFKKYDYSNNKKIELPPSEIDAGDVKKSAYTNCIANGVTRLLGIRNMTWEEVEKYSDVGRKDATKIEYKKEGQPNKPAKTNGNSNQEKATGPQYKKMYAMLKAKTFSDDDIELFKDFLKEKFKTEELSKRNMSVIFDMFDQTCNQFLEWEKTRGSDSKPPLFDPDK